MTWSAPADSTLSTSHSRASTSSFSTLCTDSTVWGVCGLHNAGTPLYPPTQPPPPNPPLPPTHPPSPIPPHLCMANSSASAATVFSPPDSCSMSLNRLLGGMALYLTPALKGSASLSSTK